MISSGSNEVPPSRRLIIPVFLNKKSCGHRCVFCRENDSDGPPGGNLTEAMLREIVFRHIGNSGAGRRSIVQIAFYGGNFTGLQRNEQQELLSLSRPFVADGTVHSLRISTRPDFLADDQILFLEQYPVRTVEIGAQSMVDEVLSLSRRGHASKDVDRAVRTLKKRGFETVIHLMAGLPGDSPEGFLYSVEKVIDLQPDMVRIHPVLVFRGTELADWYRIGRYRPLSTDEALDLCRQALERFEHSGIPVIRLGLQPTDAIERDLVAGPYHPAFRTLVEGEIFYARASELLRSSSGKSGSAVFHTAPADSSFFRGLHNRHMERLKMLVPSGVSLRENRAQERGTLKLTWEKNFEGIRHPF
jgi:histone acetyltransferase (RNA polymerase elongator complex component)